MKLNNDRKFPGERGPRADRAETKRQEAKERLEYWQSLSSADQLKKLDKRPGESRRQRERIAARKQKGVITGKVASPVIPQDVAAEVEALNAPKNLNKVKAKDRRAAEKTKQS